VGDFHVFWLFKTQDTVELCLPKMAELVMGFCYFMGTAATAMAELWIILAVM